HEQPYQPGTTSRSGAPWLGGKEAPFMRTARNALLRSRSAREKIQLAPGTDVRDDPLKSSTPDTSTNSADCAGAARSMSDIRGTPSQSAALMSPYAAAAVLPAHSIKWIPAGTARASTCLTVSLCGLSTSPARSRVDDDCTA